MSDLDDLKAQLKAQIDRVGDLAASWPSDQYYTEIMLATEAISIAKQALAVNDIDAMKSSLETLSKF